MDDMSGHISTVTGHRLNPLDPDPQQIQIADIAIALGNKCRYGGQVDTFYSVAQHCVLGDETLRKTKTSREYRDVKFAKAWLLHDANEAYLPDIPRLVKKQIPGWFEIERRLQLAIYQRFGVVNPDFDRIEYLDRRLMKTEVRDLMPRWPSCDVAPGSVAFKFVVIPWGQRYSSQQWMNCFDELFQKGVRDDR